MNGIILTKEINNMSCKEKQCADGVNASIQKAGQAPVDVRKAAPINGGKSGSAVPPTNSHTR